MLSQQFRFVRWGHSRLESWGAIVFRHRNFVALAAAAIVVLVANSAQAAGPVQKKSVTGPSGRTGTVERFNDDGNYVTLTAEDTDGPGGKCTETWVDYSTKPHEHWNPGVFVNCSGNTRSVKALTNNGTTIRGVGLVVCEVPNTSGRITRNSSNCRGQLGAMYLHSGQPYSRFDVTADKSPSGIQVYK
jgi:hypothetical protein